jgi:hypothetical protein
MSLDLAEAPFPAHNFFVEAEHASAGRPAALVMPEKDGVRLAPGAAPVPLAVVRVELEVESGASALDRALEAAWER